MTGSRRPTAGQPPPSWSSDTHRFACARAASGSPPVSIRASTTAFRSAWRSSTTALCPHPPPAVDGGSTGNAITSVVSVAAPPPMPAANPPAKSRAAERLNGPSGSTTWSRIAITLRSLR
jgi:hypothetical protein